MSFETLLEQVRQLSPAERSALVDIIQAEDYHGPAELPEWKRKLLDERLRDLEENPDDVVSWEEAMASIKRRLGR